MPSGEEYISPRISSRSSRSANVTWNKPKYPNGVITRYEVYRYEQEDLSTPILSTSSLGTIFYALASDLRPYSSYQFSVRACNTMGCSGYSSRVTTKTLPDGTSIYLSYAGSCPKKFALFLLLCGVAIKKIVQGDLLIYGTRKSKAVGML